MFLLITYDITINKRRNKIEKLLSSYGDRVNYSVFELEVKAWQFNEIKMQLIELMDKTDSVRIYELDKNSINKSIELNKKGEQPFSGKDSYV